MGLKSETRLCWMQKMAWLGRRGGEPSAGGKRDWRREARGSLFPWKRHDEMNTFKEDFGTQYTPSPATATAGKMGHARGIRPYFSDMYLAARRRFSIRRARWTETARE